MNTEAEKIMFESMVNYKSNEFDVRLFITDKKIVFEKKKGLFKKKYKPVKTILKEDIMVINNRVKIKQKKNDIILYTKDEKIEFSCNNVIEARKVIEKIYILIFGENFLERTSKKSIKVLNKTTKIVKGVGMAVVGTKIAINNGTEAIGIIKDGVTTIVNSIKK